MPAEGALAGRPARRLHAPRTRRPSADTRNRLRDEPLRLVLHSGLWVLQPGECALNRHIWIGLILSLVLLWLAARDVEFGRAWYYIQTVNSVYLLPYMGLVAGEVLIRALKWQVLLQPMKRCSFWKLNSATLIGLMANNVLPARAGEFVRAYAGARLEGIPYSMALATVVIDRVLDGLTVSAIFILVVLLHPLPEEIKGAGYLAAAIYLAALAVLVGLIVRQSATTRLLTAALRPFPARLSQLVLRASQSFVAGLSIFKSGPLLLRATGISVGIWLGFGVSFYLMFLAFGVYLSLVQAFVVLLILTIAVTLPSSPGFLGAMEWAITFGLRLFGVDESQAFALAVVYHLTQYVPITLGGIIALWIERLTMAEIAHVRSSE